MSTARSSGQNDHHVNQHNQLNNNTIVAQTDIQQLQQQQNTQDTNLTQTQRITYANNQHQTQLLQSNRNQNQNQSRNTQIASLDESKQIPNTMVSIEANRNEIRSIEQSLANDTIAAQIDENRNNDFSQNTNNFWNNDAVLDQIEASILNQSKNIDFVQIVPKTKNQNNAKNTNAANVSKTHAKNKTVKQNVNGSHAIIRNKNNNKKFNSLSARFDSYGTNNNVDRNNFNNKNNNNNNNNMFMGFRDASTLQRQDEEIPELNIFPSIRSEIVQRETYITKKESMDLTPSYRSKNFLKENHLFQINYKRANPMFAQCNEFKEQYEKGNLNGHFYLTNSASMTTVTLKEVEALCRVIKNRFKRQHKTLAWVVDGMDIDHSIKSGTSNHQGSHYLEYLIKYFDLAILILLILLQSENLDLHFLNHFQY